MVSIKTYVSGGEHDTIFSSLTYALVIYSCLPNEQKKREKNRDKYTLEIRFEWCMETHTVQTVVDSVGTRDAFPFFNSVCGIALSKSVF